jgi:hypothetical protein
VQQALPRRCTVHMGAVTLSFAHSLLPTGIVLPWRDVGLSLGIITCHASRAVQQQEQQTVLIQYRQTLVVVWGICHVTINQTSPNHVSAYVSFHRAHRAQDARAHALCSADTHTHNSTHARLRLTRRTPLSRLALMLARSTSWGS